MVTFAELGISDEICRGLDALGFSSPTPIQERVVPLMLSEQKDIVGLAQTGTGKTAAFGIPMIQMADPSRKETQALVLCPTRELCLQVSRDMGDFGKYVEGVRIVAVYGGAPIEKQIREVSRGAHVVVATPGRLHDLIRRGRIDVSSIRLAVLDEADEMLQMGFQEELDAILDETPADKTTVLLSATMPKEVARLCGKYMNEPVEISTGQRNSGSENVQHIYYQVADRDRYQALRRIIDITPEMYSIIFCRTRQDTTELAEKLVADGYAADALNGDLSQAQRDHVMDSFRARRLQILVATDVAARGLDVSDLSHVINYNLPDDIVNYTHRSGRTGRAGKTGVSIAIIQPREKYRIRQIESQLKRKFEMGRIPSGEEVCQMLLLRAVGAMAQTDAAVTDTLEPYMPALEKALASLSREELIRKFFAVEYDKVLQYYKNAKDINAPDRVKERPVRPEAPIRGKTQGFSRFVLNVGKRDGVHAKRLIGEINDACSGFARIKIGRIEISDNSALLEADSRFSAQIVSVFERLMVNGKPVSVRIDKAFVPRGGGRRGPVTRNAMRCGRKGTHCGKENGPSQRVLDRRRKKVTKRPADSLWR